MRPIGLRIFLKDGNELQWPISETEGVQFDLPVSLTRVVYEEIVPEQEVESRVSPVPGDRRPSLPKKTIRTRLLEGVMGSEIARWELEYESSTSTTEGVMLSGNQEEAA